MDCTTVWVAPAPDGGDDGGDGDTTGSGAGIAIALIGAAAVLGGDD